MNPSSEVVEEGEIKKHVSVLYVGRHEEPIIFGFGDQKKMRKLRLKTYKEENEPIDQTIDFNPNKGYAYKRKRVRPLGSTFGKRDYKNPKKQLHVC